MNLLLSRLRPDAVVLAAALPVRSIVGSIK